MSGFSVIAHSNVADVLRASKLQAAQFPFAVSLAINKTAQAVRKAEQDEMRRVFDRPTPYTLRSVYIKPSDKRKLEASAWLKGYERDGFKTTHFIGPQVFGGPRRDRRSEHLLRSRGLLRSDEFLVPGYKAKKDSYGNLSRGPLQRALSNIGVQFDPLQNTTAASAQRNKRRKRPRSEFFFRNIDGVKAVWEQPRRGDKHVYLLVVKSPRYERRLDFVGVATRTHDKMFRLQLQLSVQYAIQNPRKTPK